MERGRLARFVVFLCGRDDKRSIVKTSFIIRGGDNRHDR
jgi:hypothetical protein